MNNHTDEKLREPNGGKEFNLKEQFNLVKKRIWVLVLITVLTTSIGILKNTFFTTPLYQSSTRIIIRADQEQMKTLQVLIKDSIVLQKVAEELNINRSPEVLAQQINVGSIESSQVVRINVIDTDPKIAAEIANTTAKVYKSEVPNIIGFRNVKLLTEAKINPYPINSSQTRTLIIAIFIGIILGIGLIYFLDILDDSIRQNDEIESILGFPILGTVPKMNKKNTKNKKQNELEMRGETVGY